MTAARPFPLNGALNSAIFATGRQNNEIARDAGLNTTRLSQILRGWRAPTKTDRENLSRVLGKPDAELFAREVYGDLEPVAVAVE